MKVKDGYKQTEVGVIPEDWVVECLSNLSDVRDGTHNSPKYQKKGIKFITSKNIVNGKIDYQDVKYISEEDAINIDKRSKVELNDILMSMIGTVGNTVLIDFQPDFSIKNVALIKPLKINEEFLSKYLSSEYFRAIMNSNLAGGIQKFISLSLLRKQIIPLPPTLEEQKAIAEVLSDTDEYIESLDKLIAKKEAIKKGAMQELLTGKRRLPGFSGEWEEKRLGDVAEVQMGQSPSSANYSKDKGIPLVQGNADIKNRVTIKRVFTTQITKTCLAGDIIMTVRAPVGEVAKTYFNCCIGRGVCSISYENDFLFYYLILIENDWERFSAGSTFTSINSKHIRELILIIPSDLREQQAIADVLSDMDKEIEKLEVKKVKAEEIKEGMMQELLTGKTRLV